MMRYVLFIGGGGGGGGVGGGGGGVGYAMSFYTVYSWFTEFSSSQESVKDAPYSLRLRSLVTCTKCNIN